MNQIVPFYNNPSFSEYDPLLSLTIADITSTIVLNKEHSPFASFKMFFISNNDFVKSQCSNKCSWE